MVPVDIEADETGYISVSMFLPVTSAERWTMLKRSAAWRSAADVQKRSWRSLKDNGCGGEVKKKVHRLAELDHQMVAVKGEMETIKAWFEKQATDDLRDTKSKTVEYWGSENSKVVVGNSETVKPISMTMVKKLLGMSSRTL